MTSRPSQAALAFDRHYRAHRADVFRWCMRYGGGRSAWAEDLTHDVFLRLHAHLSTLDETSDLAPWLYRTTANLALNRLRDEQSVLGRLSKLWSSERDAAPDPEARLSRRQSVLQTLGRLPARERLVLCMKVLDGKSQQEIASALDLSEGYVSKLSARAWEIVERSGEVGHEA